MERLRRLVNRWMLRIPPIARVSEWLVRKLRRFLLGPNVWALVVRIPNGILLVEPEDPNVAASLRLSGVWQEACLDALLNVTRADSEVLVVGAHVGCMLVPLARIARRVTGIEANPNTFEYLHLNVRLNALDNVEVFNYAAGDREDRIPFLALRADSGGSRVHCGGAVRRDFMETTDAIDVPMRRLDDAFYGRRFDVVIVDIEGSEPLALAGMESIVAGADALLIEIHPHNLKDHAGGAPAELAAWLSPHFCTGLNIDANPVRGGWFSIECLQDVIHEIFSRGMVTDLLLLKSLDRWCGP